MKKTEKLYNPQKSKIKLVVYLKSGGSETFYSFHAEEKKKTDKIISNMRTRLLLSSNYFKGKFNCAIFYDNKEGIELKRFDHYGHLITPQLKAS